MKNASVTESVVFASICMGMGGFFASNICVKNMSTSFWVSIVVGALMCVIGLAFVRFGQKKNAYCGKFENFNPIMKILFAGVFFIHSASICAYFSQIIKTWVISDVNLYFISAGLCFVLCITLFKSKENLFKSVALICVFCLISVIIVRCLTIIASDTDKIFPIFEKERMKIGFWHSALIMFGVFSTSVMCLCVYFKPSAGLYVGIGASVVLFVIITLSCVVLLGAEQTANSADAMVRTMRKTNIMGRGDILFFTVWTFFMISVFCIQGACAKVVVGIKSGVLKNVMYSLLMFLLSVLISVKFDVYETFINFFGVESVLFLYYAIKSVLKKYGGKNEI